MLQIAPYDIKMTAHRVQKTLYQVAIVCTFVFDMCHFLFL